MIDIILKHIPETLTLGSMIIIGVSAWLGRFLSSSLIEKEKSNSAQNLADLRSDYQKDIRTLDEKVTLQVLKFENNLQVSKSTYEIIFDKKVAVYDSLTTLRDQYYRYKHEDAIKEEHPSDAVETYYTYFINCKSILEGNSLYISEELSLRYDQWMEQAVTHLKKASADGAEVNGKAYTDDENQQNIHDAQFPARNELVNNTQESMEKIFDQIKEDLRKIRLLVSSPLDT